MKKQIVALTAIAALTAGAAGTASASSYTVEKGDTLWGISQQNNVSVQDLKDWNELTSTIIYPNQELQVAQAEEATETYVVKQGDTLFGISKSFGITLGDLMSWNGLSSELIFPGQEFVVKGGSPVEAAPAEETVTEAPAEEAAPAEETVEEAPAEEAAPEEEAAPAEEAAAEPQQSLEGVQGTGGDDAPQAEGTTMTVEATAYTAFCEGCSGTTATGIDLRANPNQKVIAVDPSVIPLGSKVYVEGYGEAIAGDTGGAIKGNKIDIFMPEQQDALNFGRQQVSITIIE